MADSASELGHSRNPGGIAKPPLDMSVRLRLSVMMFLQFAVWGSWFTVWNVYLKAPVAKGGLGFDGFQIGSLYSTMALGAMVSMMIAGQLADRVLSSEYLMVIFHLAGAALLYGMATVHSYGALWWVSLAYALMFNPTLAIANSLAFANVPDATRDFPSLRVLGTIGWIAAGLAVDFALPAGSDATNRPLLMSCGLSIVLAGFSFALPHTPPSRKKGNALPFLRAIKLLADPSFGIFFGISFVITIALAFYYNFAGTFLKDVGIHKAASTQVIGQVSEIFFMLMLPFALKRIGMKGVLILGMGAWAVRYGLFSIADRGPWTAGAGGPGLALLPMSLVFLGVALHGVCFDFFLAAGFIYTDEKAPAEIRGSAQALFSFLTYGVGMWIGNVVSGGVVDHYTNKATGVTNWSHVWLAPAIGAAICLAFFMLLWRDKSGKVEEGSEIGAAPAAMLE